MIERRHFLGALTGAATLPTFAATPKKFPIGACDWSLGKKQDIDTFEIAKEIGLEGIQVSFSTPGSDFDLREKAIREKYYERVDQTGIQIASLGMGILNQMPLATNPESIDWVADAVDTMATMKRERSDLAPTVCLLAFFSKGDIKGKPDLMEAVIAKLKKVAPAAEENGIVLGIESYLSADDHLKIIDAVGSPTIQVYYDTANSNKMGYDIYEEVVQIGAERICQIHCKENGNLIGEGEVDFVRFAESLKKADYNDWLIIEGSMPDKSTEVVEAYRRNLGSLELIFR